MTSAAIDFAPQLAFGGTCRQAFEFYADLFGGEITVMNSFGGNEEHALPPGSVTGPSDNIRYAEARIGQSCLRGNDVNPDDFVPMRGFSLSVHIADSNEARRVFEALAQGGEVTAPLTKVDWAELFGMARDRFGVSWLILAEAKSD